MKLKQRVVISLVGVCVLCLFFLGFETLIIRGPNLLKPSVRNGNPDIGGYHISVIRKRLNKSNYTSDDFSPEGGEKFGGDTAVRRKIGKYDSSNTEMFFVNETDADVDYMLKKLRKYDVSDFDFNKIKNYSYYKFLRILKKRNKGTGQSLPVYKNLLGTLSTSWERFQKGIHQFALYSPDDPSIDDLLKGMTQEPIIDIEQKEGGTQLKLIITFSDEGLALFKPMRYPRERETLPDHFYFVDYERHNAEIAAFHLDRTIGFYRVPPTAGRLVNLTYDIKRLADHKLAKTFFKSPANNICFHGSCSYYCDTSHAVCGHPDMMEASLATFLPPEKIARRKTWRNPWKRSYSKHRKAYWEVYDDLCDKVKLKSPYNKGRRLLDLLDTHIFDFLTGNMDRHHYETFRDFGNETFHLHLDNGRAFGKSKHDEMSILAPVYQCCKIRYSTFMKLVKFYIGPDKLSSLMRTSLSKDKLTPLLKEAHLYALDRRVIKILKEIFTCIKSNSIDDVIVDDHY